MTHQDSLITALARALAHDSSPESLRRAIAAVRVAKGVSSTRAYSILVRAAAGLPEEGQVEKPAVPTQRPPVSDRNHLHLAS